MTRLILGAAALLSITAAYGQTRSEQSGKFIPERPRAGLDELTNLRLFTDVMRTDDPDLEHTLKIPAITAVTREFGPSVIPQIRFPIRSAVARARVKPWSSWWYPKKEDYLFNDRNGKYSAALTKYDLIRQMRFEATHVGPRPGSAADFERQSYNPNSLSWEGLCDAWSLASVSIPEPKKPVTMTENGVTVTFSISDLKALALKTFEAIDDTDLQYYGQKFTGNADGWIFPDIFPDQFHRYLEVQLFGAKNAFVMDHDPGVEVWNVPVYKANYVIDTIPNQPDAVFVRTWLFSAESVASDEREFVGTKEVAREYDYVLQGTRTPQGDLVIDSGYWVKGPSGVDSRSDHPDYLTRIPKPASLHRKSWNPEIDVKLVDEILSQSF